MEVWEMFGRNFEWQLFGVWYLVVILFDGEIFMEENENFFEYLWWING